MAQEATVLQDTYPAKLTYQLILRNSHVNEDTESDTGGSASETTEDSSEKAENEEQNEDYTLLEPLDGVKLTRGIEGVPARFETTVTCEGIEIKEGNSIQFKVNGVPVFFGFVFNLRRSPDKTVKITAYDQLRYLKNKDCIVYSNTASELIKQICEDYGLKMGDIANTQYVIPTRVEDNKTLVDIINYALDQTLIYKHALYHLYDDAGEVVLKSLDDMELDVYVDAESMQDYAYSTSIDKDTYDVVKVVREAPGEVGTKLVRTGLVVDEDHLKEWGRLQFLLRPDNKTVNAMDRAARIMTLKNRKTREIRLRGVLGDIRVRGGSMIFLSMDFGDVKLKNYMMVKNVQHNFTEGLHTMDLEMMYVDKPAKYEVKEDNDAEVYEEIKEAEQKGRAQRSSETVNGYTFNSDGYGGLDANQVQTGIQNAEGRVSPYGSEGCADTALYTLSYANADCKALYDAGVADTDSLIDGLQSRGYKVEQYDGIVEAGDILVYGDRAHVTVSDGVGGCLGNSSSDGSAKRYSDANEAYRSGEAPTEVIRMRR